MASSKLTTSITATPKSRHMPSALLLILVCAPVWAPKASGTILETIDSRAATVDRILGPSSELTVVAMVGDEVPGVEPATTFAGVGGASLNNQGQVAFHGYYSTAADPISGVFVASPGRPTTARLFEQSPPPGVEGEIVTWIVNASLDDFGNVVSLIDLYQPEVDTTYDEGIWRLPATGGGPVALVPGPVASVGNGALFADLGVGDPVTALSGHVLFSAYLQDGDIDNHFGDSFGFWRVDQAGNTSLIARGGIEVPTHNGAARIYGEPFATIDGTGRAIFEAELIGDGIDFTNQRGLWERGVDDALRIVVQSGQPVFGAAEGESFAYFEAYSPNSRGELLIRASLEGNGVSEENRRGLWVERTDGQLELIVRQGDPFGQSGDRRLGFLHAEILGESGAIAASSRLVNDGYENAGSAVWLHDSSGGLQSIAVTGQPAPGTGPGVVFANLAIDGIAINSRDQVLFEATLSGPGVDASNDRGVWVTALDGGLELVLREGDVVNLAEGVQRTVQFFHADYQTSTAFADGINDLGQVILEVRFVDRSSAVLISNQVAVPEPSTLALLAIALAAFFRRCVRTTSRPSAVCVR